MIKKTFLTLLTLILISTNSYSAGSSNDGGGKSNYDKAVTLIKAAKNMKKKVKQKKPIKDMRKLKPY